MDKQEILNTIKQLSKSQGFYGRILDYINDGGEKLLDELVKANIKDPVDLVMFFES